MEETVTPDVLKLNENAAPGSPKEPVWRRPNARSVEAFCCTVVAVLGKPVAEATFLNVPPVSAHVVCAVTNAAP